MERQEIIKQLREGVIVVTFTKVDGSQRRMRCTLNDAYLPPKALSDKYEGRERSQEAISVWDLDKNDWRSFRFDSLIEVEAV